MEECFKIMIRVGYDETDNMGIIHHANYLKYLERARWEAFREIGLCYAEIERKGIIMPVIELKSKYIMAAKYDEFLTVKTKISEMRGAKIRFDYEIVNSDDKIINKASTILATVNKATGKACKPPEYIKEVLNRII
jgi:acyl-CoA thioester hydrolase